MPHKSLFFYLLIFGFAGTSCDHSGSLKKELQGKKWFVHGEFWEKELSADLNTDSTGKYEWSAQFAKDQKMIYNSFIGEAFIDTGGVFHPKGEKFTDTSYRYAIRNNILKVTKGYGSYYLLLVPKAKNEFKILSVSEYEFEKQQ